MSEYAHIRAAFREVALGLMEWREPPTRKPKVYRSWDKQNGVEPFNVQADWDERS